MYPITNAVKALFESEQRQTLRITGTDKNNTSISITDADVLIGSFNIDRFSCVNDRIEIGTATAAEMTLQLNNANGAFDSIIFEGTELYVEIGIADWSQENPTIIYIPCGYFTPNVQPRRMNIITLKALDRMTKFDLPVDASSMTFPASISSIVGQVCTICGVTLAASINSLPNASLVISELPNIQQEITYRNLIQWCAGIMGTCAFMDWDGKLAFAWYAAASYISAPSNRFSSDLYENDIEITGVEYTNTQNVTIIAGTADYTLDMTGNYLMSGYVSEVVINVNTALNGFTYRPFSASAINAPYIWPMDIITFTDRDGNNHNCIVTNVNFGVNSTTELEGKGMTDEMNGLSKPSAATREQGFLIERAIKAAVEEVDDSLTQQDIFNRLTNNGQEQGIYLQNGKIYINASYIQSGTLVLGGLNNGNGTLEILDANGNVIGTWDNSGVEIDKGSFKVSVDSDTSMRINAPGYTPSAPNYPIQVRCEASDGNYTTFIEKKRLYIERNDTSDLQLLGYASLGVDGLGLVSDGGSTTNPSISILRYGTGSYSVVIGQNGITMENGAHNVWFEVNGDINNINGPTMALNSFNVPTILSTDSHSFSNVAAGGTDSYAVSASLGTTDYIVATEINTGNCTVYITNRATTGFTLNVKNISNASSSPTVRWAVIKTS